MLETPEVIINPGSIQAEIECNKDLEITLQKREFSIVGDNVYVTASSEAPQWLLDLINGAIANAIADGTADFDDLRENILNAIAAMDIAKNDYDSYVIKLEDAEGKLLAYVETLNATVADSVAEIVSVLVTKATPAEASALAVEAIQASINAGAIKSQLDTIKQTVATESSTRALQIDTLTSAITDENSGLAANATAVETLYTYVGIDGDLTPTGTGLLSTIEIIQKQNDGVIDTYAGTHYIKVCDANLDDGDLNQLLTNQYPYALWTPMEGSGVPTATTRVVYRDAVSSNEPIVTYTIYKDTATNLKYIYDANTSSWSAITDTEYNNYYETLRAAHVGDVYILYSIEEGVKVYNEACKFVKTAVDTTSPYNTDAEGYGWLRITDTDAQAAYMQALNAYDLADNKRRVFVSTPVLPYDEGDLWVDSSGTYKVVKIYKNGSWVVADEQTAQFANEVYTPTVTTLKNQVDGKIEYYFYNNYTEVSGAISESTALNIIDNAWSTTALKEAANGNVVYFKDTDNGYWYSSTTSNWEALEDTSMLSALRKAEQAKSSADAKVTAYSVKFELQATATTPLGSYVEGNYIIIYRSSATNDTGSVYQKLFYKNSTSIVEHTSNLKVGDIAVGSRAYIKPGTSTAVATEVVYKWAGTAWAELDGRITAISEWGIALENFLETGTTTGTTIDSSSNVYSTLRSEADSDRLNTESKFGYNSNLIVNGKAYTTGFGLVSTGTQTGNWTDPVNGINYPTFNSEFWIKSDKFKLTAANGLVSNYVPFEVDGTTGDIKFKGKVTFSSISDASTNIPTISSVTTAQSTANTAQTTANSKTATFYTSTTPSAITVGDLWIDSTANKYYKATAIGTGGWVQIQDITSIATTAATSVASTAVTNNNDVLAQQLGYTDYNAMVAAATLGQTIINGGYINTNLINANAITANQINTSGLIAENISGTNLISKNISGSNIYGAYIEGAVIKASYLDLDGELEVLTNYHIPVASYNPSTMPGAIYIAASNEYRLPTTSSVSTISPTMVENTTNVFTSNQPVYPYNSYWTTSIRRVVKIRPVITVPNDIVIFDLSAFCFVWCYSLTINYSIYIGGVNIGTFSGTIAAAPNSSTNTMTLNGLTGNLVYNGITFSCIRSIVSSPPRGSGPNIKLTLKAGNYTLTNDWTTGEFIKIVYNSGTANGGEAKRVPTFGDFTVNNMI